MNSLTKTESALGGDDSPKANTISSFLTYVKGIITNYFKLLPLRQQTELFELSTRGEVAKLQRLMAQLQYAQLKSA